MKRHLAAAAAALVALAGCAAKDIIPATGPDRDSGQSSLMDGTFAGKNKCNPDDHLRPFIIEWDATDMSSFQARAESDVVFVKYEGCALQVLEGCVNSDVRGSLGAYNPPEWTSGSVEKIDIRDEGELYTKLPLGVATIGGRVAAGEAFQMEYFVAGTRGSTRAAVYRNELETNPNCADATHFVYGYNLGAFALGSHKQVSGEVEVSVKGAGIGGKRGREKSAEKQGGLLGACRAESATEVKDCQVPIRLTLRPVSDGDNPDVAAAMATESDEALNLAGKLKSEGERMNMANELRAAAMRAFQAGDGKACLKGFDGADKLDPDPGRVSTNPRGVLTTRAMCVMLAGNCKTGKKLVRQAQQATNASMRPEMIDQTVDGIAAQYCKGGKTSVEDKLRAAATTLRLSSSKNVSKKECTEAIAFIEKNAPKVKSKDNELYEDVTRAVFQGPTCYASAGDCKSAWALFKKQIADSKPSFEASVRTCKGKI
jgi:hypothetical protein